MFYNLNNIKKGNVKIVCTVDTGHLQNEDGMRFLRRQKKSFLFYMIGKCSYYGRKGKMLILPFLTLFRDRNGNERTYIKAN